MFNLTVYGNLLPIPSCDNRYGFDLDAFPQDSVAALLDGPDNAMVVVRPDGTTFVNFDTIWFKGPDALATPTVDAVNAALASITSDPEAYLYEEWEDADEADDEHIRVMGTFGWVNDNPY